LTVFATETWEGRALGSNPDGTGTTTGAITWYDNFHTKVALDPLGSGNKVLEFPYDAGFPDPVTEIWFDLHQNLTEVWIRYEIYIPANYEIVDRNPSSPLQLGGGEKEFVLFGDGYSNNYPTLILGRDFQRRVSDGGALITPPTKVFQYGDFKWTDNAGVRQTYQLPNASAVSMEPLIDITKDLGAKQVRLLHLAMPTTSTSNNGVCEYWVYKNGVPYKIIDVHDGPWWGAFAGSTGGNYINGGYILGSSGSGFNVPTSFFVGDTEWSNANDFPSGGGGNGCSQFADFSVRF
jgi:hypothetical protein